MSQEYKNIIFTKHAYERIVDRSLALHSVFETVNYPDAVYKKDSKSNKYIKTIQNRRYHVVATYKPDQKKHLIISAWVRGEEDKQPLIWQLITLPFKIVWWLIKRLFKLR
ncbi:MAG: hypothetical protein BroJett025_03280 [Patescibacteria group bacterium]|nr:MAG: hypothetical protein BroJett025_03280 [Patescibacteria group bacterium]